MNCSCMEIKNALTSMFNDVCTKIKYNAGEEDPKIVNRIQLDFLISVGKKMDGWNFCGCLNAPNIKKMKVMIDYNMPTYTAETIQFKDIRKQFAMVKEYIRGIE